MNDLTGASCFILLFALVGTVLLWMHFAIWRMDRARLPELKALPELPEMFELHSPAANGASSGHGASAHGTGIAAEWPKPTLGRSGSATASGCDLSVAAAIVGR